MAEDDKILIVGAGTVGSHLSDLLQKENFQVVVIDADRTRLERLSDRLDVQTLHGHGADPALLQTAGAAAARLLLAMTNADEVNLLSAYTAKRLGARQAIARARSAWCLETSLLDFAETLGIDELMNPELLTAHEIISFLDHPEALALERFARGRVQLRTVVIDPKSSFAGKALRDCHLPEGMLAAVISKDGRIAIPNGDTVLEPGANLTVLGEAELLPQAQRMFHPARRHLRSAAIAGGGATGLFLAEALEKREFSVKVIESDRERSAELGRRLRRAQVIHGDATDIAFMKEERLAASDVFIAVTGDDENNLMACLLARECGVERTVVKIERPDYASLIQKFGVTLALSPRHVMAERILTLLRGARVQAIALLEDGQVEVVEIVAGHGSPLVGRPLAKVSLPRGTLIGAIVHLGRTIIPRGGHQIEPGDTVVAVGLHEAIGQLEKSLAGR